MPTDVVSLLLYAGLLLPGFAFSVARAVHRPVETRSAFRETTSAVAVSLICDAVLLTVVLVVASLVEPWRAELYREAKAPLNEFQAQPVWTIIAIVLFYAIAATLGFLLGTSKASKAYEKIFNLQSEEQVGSSWHTAFNMEPGKKTLLGIELMDGTWLQGYMFTFDNSAVDSGDRGVVLTGDILRRRPDEPDLLPLEPYGSLVVNDRNIKFMTIAYVDEAATTPADQVVRGLTDVKQLLPRANRTLVVVASVALALGVVALILGNVVLSNR
jgi:hypothetical protein